jgi:sigma-B regulation protein RsbU (phosphoserine phosphatase)
LAEDRFRALFDHASDAHMIVVDGGITDCNDAMVEILGARGRDQILALHPAALSPERQPDGRLSAEKSREMDATARRRGWHRFEWLHQRLDGEPLPVDVTLNAITIDGRPGLVAVWHDLRERKRLEAELRRSAAELAEANARLTQANERMKAELDAAAVVQRALLPQEMPALEGVSIAWRFRPCAELAGDLLDVFRLDERRIGFYVLDVTGHGVAASLLSVAVSHALSPHASQSAFRRSEVGPDADWAAPAEIVRRLHRDFSERGGPLQLFTICCGVLDLTTRTLDVVSAGHPGPLRVSRRGEPELLQVPSLPVGILKDVAVEGARVVLEPGDRLLVYSDGFPEARAPSGEVFGVERLAAALHAAPASGTDATQQGSTDLEAALDHVIATVEAFTAPAPPHDDISLVALELRTP